MSKNLDEIKALIYATEIRDAYTRGHSEVTSQLMKLNNSVHFMGLNAYLSGITANIAKSLTHLNISLGNIKTYSSTKKALKEILGDI